MNGAFVQLSLGGIGVFLLAQAGLLIWHMSRMNTTLNYIRVDLEKAMTDFERRDFKREAELAKVWQRIDENRQRIVVVEQKVKAVIRP